MDHRAETRRAMERRITEALDYLADGFDVSSKDRRAKDIPDREKRTRAAMLNWLETAYYVNHS